MLKTSTMLAAVAAGASLAAELPYSGDVPYPGAEAGAAQFIDLSANDGPTDGGVCNASLVCVTLNDTLTFGNRETRRGGVDSSCAFRLDVAGGQLSANDFQVVGRSSSVHEDGSHHIILTFKHEDSGLEVQRETVLNNGAHYVRHVFTIKATKDVELTGFTPVVAEGKDFKVVGEVAGSPVVSEWGRIFIGVELPVAEATVEGDSVTIGFPCKLPMAAGQAHTFSVVMGVYPEGQLRRGFLSYLEKERAVPYHQFLQYNCWYDHGLNPTEQKMLDTVKAYGEELVSKRGISLDSFVLDDGWDDFDADLWQPNPEKFPQGFGKLSEALRGINSHFGIWISPLGGYSGANERVAHAKRMGLLPQEATGMDLSEPGYYNWYLGRCRELMQKDGVNFFKWDRAGGGVSPHFMSLLRIAGELRKIDPGVFLSTTVGTWPSPFWLNFVDCTWRTGSSDVNWIGPGSNREQYITYRDARCYSVIVQKGPLYPLNSIMHHGIVLGTEFQGRRTSDARHYEGGQAQEPKPSDGDFLSDTTIHTVDFPVNNDLRKDIRILMGSGANLQELYLTPSMMNAQAWDDVAEAVRWSRKHAAVLADVHWVGGDPEKGEVYGYAAWHPTKGATLALRNPGDTPRNIKVTADMFEPMPGHEVGTLKASYADQRVPSVSVGEEVQLEPFEVLVFDKE